MAMGSFDESAKERLSALADGELAPAVLAAACAEWRVDAGLRADWHAWHVIGDVLRSEDLASDPRRDRRLCAAVGERLRAEPVILAPPAPAARGVERRARPTRWAAGAAVAAGVVLVAGTFALVRPGESPAPERIVLVDRPAAVAAPAVTPLATAPAVTPVATIAPQVKPAEVAATPVALVADIRLIRDARLDRYLEAHKQFAGTSALGVPSAFLRSATVESAGR